MNVTNYYLRVSNNETVQVWAADRPIKTKEDLRNSLAEIYNIKAFTDDPAYEMSQFPIYELHEVNRSCWLTVCLQYNLLTPMDYTVLTPRHIAS